MNDETQALPAHPLSPAFEKLTAVAQEIVLTTGIMRTTVDPSILRIRLRALNSSLVLYGEALQDLADYVAETPGGGGNGPQS